MNFSENDLGQVLKAVRFAAEKHMTQRRKGADASPYVNHPIEAAELLWRVGGVRDVPAIVAAILHDTVEDTSTTPEELEREFGPEVRAVVGEVSDDKSLPKERRKELQVEHAPHVSDRAKLVKLADKTCNVRDVSRNPPADWSLARRLDYLDWAERVVAGLRGVNERLEATFDRELAEGRERLGNGAG